MKNKNNTYHKIENASSLSGNHRSGRRGVSSVTLMSREGKGGGDYRGIDDVPAAGGAWQCGLKKTKNYFIKITCNE